MNKIKTIQAIIFGSMLIYVGIIMFAPDYETIALEKAWGELSYEDSIIISDYLETYTEYIDLRQDALTSAYTLFFWIMLIGIAYQTHLVFSRDTSEKRIKEKSS